MKLGVVTKNVIANVGGNVWAGLMSIAFIPLYIRFMGMEAYGLVGFFLTLQAIFSLFDLGLSTTLNREFARLSAHEGTRTEMRSLLRSLEMVYWAIGLLNATAIIALSHVIAYKWVNAQHLPGPTVQHAVIVMGLVVAAQWPLGLYSGGLQGLQRQVLLNGINAVAATLRGVGSILILWLISPSIIAFFAWQSIVSLIHTIAVALALWREVRDTAPARFAAALLRSIYQFAAGMLGISALGIVLSQLDKLILSKLLSLEAFGYYSVAAAVAASLYRLASPVFTALFPRFAQLAASGEESLVPLYHRACQSMAAIIVPIAVFVAFFSRELLELWTRSSVTARVASPILSLLILGTAINGLLNLPYALQLAYGWTRLSLAANATAVAILGPALFFATYHYGAIGAAVTWCLYNIGYSVIVIRIMHRRILPGEEWRWYGQDTGLPIVAAVAAAALTRILVSAHSVPILIVQLVLAGGFVQLVTCAALPSLRRTIFARLRAA
ncbi:MAG TPA: oligosaccharide flippase family protein [Thermoanaerobaculia bacterium]|nr:oligosaccharide flippase family protein [Thermoanaerobaculia bacterium]